MNIIITGASKGIGKAVATIFAAEGARLFLCARNMQDLNQTVAGIQEKYPDVVIHAKQVDLADRVAAKDFAAWCLSFGVPDILVNNAGLYQPGHIYDEHEGSLEMMMGINLYGAYYLTRALLPAMMDQSNTTERGRHIFNICSIASLNAYPNGGGYSISKFAMLGFSKNLREELKPHRIRVTAVSPGAVLTNSWGDFDNSKQRIMEADDVARMILSASQLSPQAVVEDIVMRPILGDL
jgi:short-subunit dehydrogenase